MSRSRQQRPRQQRPRRPEPRRASGRMPLAVVSGLAILGGAAIVIVLAALNGQIALPGPGQPTGSASSPGAIATPRVSAPPELADGRSLGPANAPVQLELWTDFQCPSCRTFTEAIEPMLIDTYIRPGRARLVFRDAPFIGSESFTMAEAARCAGAQGSFWPYHDLLYANQPQQNSGTFTDQRAAELAAFVGLDADAFTACLTDPGVASAVLTERNDGVRVGVSGTPTLLVNGARVAASDWAAVSAAIETAAAPNTP